MLRIPYFQKVMLKIFLLKINFKTKMVKKLAEAVSADGNKKRAHISFCILPDFNF